MNPSALTSAMSLHLDMVILLLRDDAYGMIKWRQEERKLPNFGMEFQNPDFVQYALAHGIKATRITATQPLMPTLQRCLGEKGVHLIEVPIDYSQNTYMLSEQLLAQTCPL